VREFVSVLMCSCLRASVCVCVCLCVSVRVFVAVRLKFFVPRVSVCLHVYISNMICYT